MTMPLHPVFEYDDDSSWFTLHSWLEFRVRNWVYDSHFLRWQGEEEEAIADIVSESITHILDRQRKVTRGEADPIKFFIVDSEEAVLQAIYDEQFFKLMAREIVAFPKKQKEAVLRDHARLIESMANPASLLRAYQAVGIQLKDYCHYAPADPIEKRRHASLLHIAYKRLSCSPLLRQYIYGKVA